MATSVKDILNTEVPKPSFVLSPSVAAPLPSGVTHSRSGGDDVARTLDPYSGKFEYVPEDTPRVYGSDQSLLVEAARRTNQVLNSSDASNTSQAGANGATVSDASSELLKGVDADSKRIESQGDPADLRLHDAGSHSGNTETIRLEVEEGTSGFFRVVVVSSSDENYSVEVDFSAESHNVRSDVENHIDSIEKKFTNNGPNGGKKLDLRIRHSGFTSGVGRFISIGPNSGTTGEDFIHYHTQLEEAPNASSPIVTSGSAKTRAADDYKISVGDWWNTTEGSFLLTGTSRVFAGGNTFGNTGQRWLNGANSSRLHYNNGDLRLFDSSGNTVDVLDATTAFSPVSVGFSFTQAEMRLSANGSSNNNDQHDASWSIKPPSVKIGKLAASATFQRIIYIPRALPESTLNVLTT